MFDENTIEERQEIRVLINAHRSAYKNPAESILLLISESLDQYIEHRIKTDKVMEGILKDIQGNIASMAETKVETNNSS